MGNCTNLDEYNNLKKAYAEVCVEKDAYKEEIEIIGEAKMRSDDLYRLLRRYCSEVKWEKKNNV